MITSPTFSIIVPTFQRPERLSICLKALARLSYPSDCFETVVVDDGSQPSPQAVVDEARPGLPNLTLIIQNHAGPAQARNMGAQRSKGDFLAFTDDDCVPDPGWLSAFAERFTERPEQAIGGQTVNALTDNPFSTASQDLVTYLYNHFNAYPSQARFFTSNNIAMPKALFQSVGGFDKYFPFAAAEDRDFCDRWLAQGLPLVYAPEAIIYHSHALSWRSFWRQHFHYGRGAYHFHKLRARRQHGAIRLEPLNFYIRLLTDPFRQFRQRHKGLTLALLTLLSQIANAAGYFKESWMEQGT